jgi:hypothetical protein
MKAIIYISTLLPIMITAYNGDCIPSCEITTVGTQWDYANVRSNPCNNRPAITQLYDGDVVYNLDNNRFGCGYWYTQVLYGNNNVGWVASQFLDCGGNPPVAAAALEDETGTGSI